MLFTPMDGGWLRSHNHTPNCRPCPEALRVSWLTATRRTTRGGDFPVACIVCMYAPGEFEHGDEWGGLAVGGRAFHGGRSSRLLHGARLERRIAGRRPYPGT